MSSPIYDARGHSSTSWLDISTDILQAELARRQNTPRKPVCGSTGRRGTYNLSLHVFALILILVLSTAACSFPIIVRRFPHLKVPHQFLFLSRHFGTGVLIATAFVHLLPTAFISLTDPCLPAFWNKGYPAMAGLIAMTAVLMVVGIEMFFTTRGAGHIHGNDYGNSPEEEGHIGHTRKSSGHTRSRNHRPQQLKLQGVHGDEDLSGSDLEARGGSSDHLIWGKKSTPNESPTTEGATKYLDNNSEAEAEDSDLDLDELDPTVDNANLLRFNHTFPARSRGSSYIQPPSTPSIHSSSVSDTQLQQKLILQCFLLEAGILFHSIFIGMALSISVGAPFIVLLIAISFHQTFEGFALGSRIAAIPSFSTTSPKPWLMALAYGLTTPIGQAIGLAVHRLYDPQSQTGLLTVGVTNAVSSGLLLFAGLVELLAEDFLSEGSYASLKGKKRLQACGAVVGGAALMALVGAWA